MATKKTPEGFVDIELSREVEMDGAKVKALRMREPTVGDQLAADEMKGGEAAKEISVFANLCEVSPEDIKKLTLKDYKKLQAAFVGFIA